MEHLLAAHSDRLEEELRRLARRPERVTVEWFAEWKASMLLELA